MSDESSGSSAPSDSWSGAASDGGLGSPGEFGGEGGGEGGGYTETTRKSWFQRLQEAIVGVLVGVALGLGSIVGLFWNEGRAVTTSRSLSEGAASVVSAAPTRREVKLSSIGIPLRAVSV